MKIVWDMVSGSIGLMFSSVSPFFLATTGAPGGSIVSANDPQIYINYSPDTQATESSRLEDSQNPVSRVPMVCTEHAKPES
jgi:hypothetical protein